MSRLPESLPGDGFLLRLWRVADAERQQQAIIDSLDHLRPWMAWIAQEPQTLEQRRATLANWVRAWEQGGDAFYAVLVEHSVAGSCGFHRRLGPGALEIGYWIHAAFVRRGLATRVAARLTDAAFGLPEIERVEIHHDRANVASAGVPRGLGFVFVEERIDEALAPADTGLEWIWRLRREDWEARAARGAGA